MKFIVFDLETVADTAFQADYRQIDPHMTEGYRDAARRITAAGILAIEIDSEGRLAIGRHGVWSLASVGSEAAILARLTAFVATHPQHGLVSWSGQAHDVRIVTMAAMRHGVSLPPQLRLHQQRLTPSEQLAGARPVHYPLGRHFDLAVAMMARSGRYCHLAEVLLNLGIPAQMLRYKMWHQDPQTAGDWAWLESHVMQDVVFTAMAMISFLASQGTIAGSPRLAIGRLSDWFARAGLGTELVCNRFAKLAIRMMMLARPDIAA